MKSKVKITHLPLTVERNDDGFLARCPFMQGAFAEGDTLAGAIFNCLDVVNMILAYRRERAENLFGWGVEELPKKKEITFTIPIEV